MEHIDVGAIICRSGAGYAEWHMWVHLMVILSFLYLGCIGSKVSLGHTTIFHPISHKSLNLVSPKIYWRNDFLISFVVRNFNAIV